MELNAQLNFILLGKKGAGKSSSGNTILGRQAFTTKKCSKSVTQDQTMGSGTVDGFSVTVYDTPGFFDPELSEHEIQQKIEKVLHKSEVGEWAFLIVIKADSFTEEERITVEKIEKLLGEKRFQKTWILFTRADELEDDNVTEQEFLNRNGRLEKLVQKYDQRYHMFNNKKKGPSEQVKMLLTKIIQPFVKEKVSQTFFRNQKLNLVFCGNYERLKESVSKLLEGEKTFLPPLHQECARKALDLHGRQINMLELPALSRLAEEEVMHQTLRCVSLCDPGVHAFLFFISDAPLTHEDKAEMEEIQKIFSSRINKHMIIVNLKMNNQINIDLSSEISIQTFGARQFVLENSSRVPDLLQDVENMVQENSFYTSFMFLQAQIELEKNKHKAEIEELKRFMMKTQPAEADVTHDDLRIVLLGKTGVGKSASANTILRKTAFKSALASKSVTRECQKDRAEISRGHITMIDTPGLFDTGIDNAEIMKEIVKCVSMAAPGPHVFLLVIPLGRFTKEEKDAVKMIQEMFGDQSSMYTMVLFTRGDDLRGTRIEDYIEGDRSLQNLLHQCGNRYHVFSNNENEDQTQVSELLEKIDHMVAVNGGSFYTNEMFQLVEKNIREEQKRILKEKEEEIKRKEKEMKDKYEAEIEQIKNETERKRQEMQDELRKKEEEFKKKEEEIKKEKDESQHKELKRKLEEQQKWFEEENKKKEMSLEEQQHNFKKYLEEQHEKENQKLKEKIKREIRDQAEEEYRKKIDSIPYRSKRARDWSYYVPIIGGAAGAAYGTGEDIYHWIFG